MSSGEGKPEMQQIDITKLNLQQLNNLKQQLDQELQFFQDSLQTLKMAQSKMQDSKEVLEKIKPESKGSQILVPLTGSIYVPGTISDSENVVIDIGTGYYLQKDIECGKDYFKRKVEFITQQMEKVQAVGLEKSKIRDGIIDIMEYRIQAQIQAQKQVETQ